MKEKDAPLPTRDYVKQQYNQIRPLMKVIGFFNKDIAKKTKDLEGQFEKIEQMEKDRLEFVERFSPMGWTLYDNISVDIVSEVVSESNDEEAEKILATYHTDLDHLERLGYRFNISRYEAWRELYERAIERANHKDFLSAVPLILIIIDGICTTKTGKHPFSGGADAPVFDSEVSRPGGISDGLAILGSTRRKLDTTEISSPYRHGIIHGLNPSFGNLLVMAKAFNLLQASIDYFDRRDDEEERLEKAASEQREPSWSEVTDTLMKNQEARQRIDEWQRRPEISNSVIASSDDNSGLVAESPEATAAQYLSSLEAKNFGSIAKLTIDFPLRSIKYRAGKHREELGELEVTGWEITGIRDEAPAISVVTIYLSGVYDESEWSGEQTMRLIYGDSEYKSLVRTDSNGSWAVMPNFINELWATMIRSTKDNIG